MTLDDVEQDPVEVWPENWAAVRLFDRLGDQWRGGVSGPTGMDYTLAIKLMERMALSEEAFDVMLDDLQTMAHAALEEMRKEG